jgi:hypothetical protein
MNSKVENVHKRLDDFVLTIDTAPVPKDFNHKVMDRISIDDDQGVIVKMMSIGQQPKVQFGLTLIGLLWAANRLLRFVFGAWLFASVAY